MTRGASSSSGSGSARRRGSGCRRRPRPWPRSPRRVSVARRSRMTMGSIAVPPLVANGTDRQPLVTAGRVRLCEPWSSGRSDHDRRVRSSAVEPGAGSSRAACTESRSVARPVSGTARSAVAGGAREWSRTAGDGRSTVTASILELAAARSAEQLAGHAVSSARTRQRHVPRARRRGTDPGELEGQVPITLVEDLSDRPLEPRGDAAEVPRVGPSCGARTSARLPSSGTAIGGVDRWVVLCDAAEAGVYRAGTRDGRPRGAWVLRLRRRPGRRVDPRPRDPRVEQVIAAEGELASLRSLQKQPAQRTAPPNSTCTASWVSGALGSTATRSCSSMRCNPTRCLVLSSRCCARATERQPRRRTTGRRDVPTRCAVARRVPRTRLTVRSTR